MAKESYMASGGNTANPQNAVSSAAGHFDVALERARYRQKRARGRDNPALSNSPSGEVRHFEAASMAAKTFNPGELVEYSDGYTWRQGNISYDNAVRVNGVPLETFSINSLRRVGETKPLSAKYLRRI